MAAESPIPVCLVSFGTHDVNGGNFRDWASHESFVFVDASILRKDPGDHVGYQQNGTHALTQTTVFGQDGFVGLVTHVLQSVVDGEYRIAVHCKKGWHRSDVVCRVVEDLLNQSPIDHDHLGPRFTAKHFPISQAWPAQYDRVISDICSWLTEPWWAPAGGGLMPREHRFGHQAAMVSRQSAANWNEVQDTFILLTDSRVA